MADNEDEKGAFIHIDELLQECRSFLKSTFLEKFSLKVTELGSQEAELFAEILQKFDKHFLDANANTLNEKLNDFIRQVRLMLDEEKEKYKHRHLDMAVFDAFNKHIELFYDAIRSVFQEIACTHFLSSEVIPISGYDFKWESDKLRDAEWQYAKLHLVKNGQLCPHGTKLRRKDHLQHLTHSFIVFDGRILALAPQHASLIDKPGAYAKNVKLAEDEKRNSWAVKIIENPEITSSFEMKEEDVAADLNMALASTKRMSKSGLFKKYIPYVFVGTPLRKYLQSRPFEDEERLDIAIKLLVAVQRLHSGQSKSRNKYLHGDLHGGNITIDKQGNVHLIDYDSSRVFVSTANNLFYQGEVKKLGLLLEDPIFTKEMLDKYPTLKNFLQKFSELPPLTQLIQDLITIRDDLFPPRHNSTLT